MRIRLLRPPPITVHLNRDYRVELQWMPGTGLVTIQPDGTETISGDTPLVLTSQWDSVVFVSDGTNWVRCS